MFKRKELAEIPNVKPIAAETKKQRAKEEKQRSKQLRRSAKQSEMNAAQSARSIKKCRAPEKAADCLQYERMYESGICEVEPGLFSMTMAFTDVNFQLARQEEQKSLFTQYSEFLNYFDPDTHLQISLVTRRVDEAEFRRDTFLPLRGDNRDRYSEEMNRVISEKALQGQNGLIREKYITISLHEDDYRKAQVRLLKRAEDIQNLFKRMGSTVRRLSGIERLNLLHGITRPEEVMGFSYDWLLAEDSLTTKDFIAPSGYNWKPEHDDSRAVYNDRYQFGEYYGKVLYLRDIAPQMKDNLLSLLSDLDFDNAISIHVDAVEQREAVEQVQKQLAYMQKEKGDGMVNAVRMNLPAYMGVRYELTNQIEDAEELLDNLHNYNQKIFKVCILIHTYGRNNAELDERVQQICNTVQQQTCRFSPIPFEQCAAMNSVLPLGKKWLALERTLLTVNTAIYVPFTTQELFQPGGLYEGTNARSKNLIMVNRKLLPAPAGMVLGMTGFGKSFAVMQMMAGIMLRWPEDDLVIIDPENEYARLVEAFGGEVIEISASSKSHINPMDISEDYGDEGNPIQLKSQFLRDFCQLVLNSKELSAQECSLVDRAALITYQKYLLHPEREQMPSLHDFYNNLSLQGSQAKALTMALSMYVDGTMDLFAHQTNVDLQNHCICFNTVKLGKSMQSIGMMTVLDQIWNRITRNRVLGRRTWIFTDEFQLLLGNSACTNYYFELSSRARKWGAILTSITQHVRSVLNNEDARRMLSDCGYIKLLNQAPDDANDIARLLHISDEEKRYIENAEVGSGLLIADKVVVPFNNTFPQDTELFRLMDTNKDGEDAYGNVEWASLLYRMDWEELYGIVDGIKCRATGSGMTEEELRQLFASLNIDATTARGQVVAFALSCQGKFVYAQPSSLRGGPGNPSVGINLDCSSFVQYCYWAQNLLFSAGSTAAYRNAADLVSISPSEVQPGDLRVVYASGGEQGHVQMALGGGAWIECCYGYGVAVNMSNTWMESRPCYYFRYAGF
mgnify:CR=1 FL=1